MVKLSWFEEYDDSYYDYGYDMSVLQINQAYLDYESLTGEPFFFYKKHHECLDCPYESVLEFIPPMILQDVPHYYYRLSRANKPTTGPGIDSDFICDVDETFGEFGIYKLLIKNDSCLVEYIKEPVSIVFPMLTVFLLYCGLFAVVFALIFLYKKFLHKSIKGDDDGEKEANKKVRIKSLDTFRGISIVIMIFVNYGAGGYAFFEHAVWNGLNLADLVFPWFMWIMGACIPISLASSFKKEIPSQSIFLNVLKRSIKLFIIGVMLVSGRSLKCLRVFGVLQRFGICYLAVTTICLYCMNRNFTIPQGKIKRHIADFLILWRAWLVVLAILLLHTLLIFLVADEGCPKGYLGPGGWHDNLKYFNCTGGATGFIDRLILGDHVLPWPTTYDIYKSQAFDPEGLVGCLTSIVHVFLGVQAGIIVQVYKGHRQRLIRWLIWSVITGLIGGGLCGFSREDGVIPVNKNLWSLSFVLVTSCFAFALLAACYFLIDLMKWWSGKPFLFAGMNAIIMYIGHSVLSYNFPIRWKVDCRLIGHRTHFITFLENIWATGCWVLISYYLYKINYFFTV